MKVQVEVSYTAYGSAEVELPDGKSWDDVESWYVKWDMLNIMFKGQEKGIEIALATGAKDMDMKRPNSTYVYAIDDEGEVDYGKELT